MQTGLPDILAAGDCVITHHRHYPGSHRITMRVTGDRRTGRLPGMQLFGHKHAEIAEWIDIAATANYSGNWYYYIK